MSLERFTAIKREGRRQIDRFVGRLFPERPYTQADPILLTSNFRPDQFRTPIPNLMEEDGSLMHIGEGLSSNFTGSNVILTPESPVPLYHLNDDGASFPFEVALDLSLQAQFVFHQINDRKMTETLDRQIVALREAVENRPHLKPTALVTE